MGKEDSISYKSEMILGRLYRSIQEASGGDLVSEEICTSNDLPYDTDLEVPGASDFPASAWQCKCSYEAQLNELLNQYRVHTEAEIVTGHIWSLSKHNSRKQGEKKERLKNSNTALRREFRSIFLSIASDQREISDDEKNLVYEMTNSAWYQVTYHRRWIEKTRGMMEPDGEEMPVRLSFAWIAVHYLVRIKLRCHGEVKVEGQRPVEKLAAYFSERISGPTVSNYLGALLRDCSKTTLPFHLQCRLRHAYSRYQFVVLGHFIFLPNRVTQLFVHINVRFFLACMLPNLKLWLVMDGCSF